MFCCEPAIFMVTSGGVSSTDIIGTSEFLLASVDPSCLTHVWQFDAKTDLTLFEPQ
jgi:hypothetical protein